MNKIDGQTVAITFIGIALLGLVYLGGYDYGRRNLVAEMKHYGCEKTLAVYQEHEVKK